MSRLLELKQSSAEPRENERSRRRPVVAAMRDPEIQNTIVFGLCVFLAAVYLVLRYDLGLARLIAEAEGHPKQPGWMIEAAKKDPEVGSLIRLPQLSTPEGEAVR